MKGHLLAIHAYLFFASLKCPCVLADNNMCWRCDKDFFRSDSLKEKTTAVKDGTKAEREHNSSNIIAMIPGCSTVG